jgi:hypothetical protein
MCKGKNYEDKSNFTEFGGMLCFFGGSSGAGKRIS